MSAKRILIAEDQAEVRDFLVRVLRDEGYELNTVGNGYDLLKEALTNGYDLILADVRMPKGYGDDMITILREKGIETPALVVTGVLPHATVPEGVDILEKPVDLDVLKSKVASLLA